jgi:hypothetical protein
MPGTAVSPGGKLSYGASLASATSATLGYYTGTLTVNFQDQFGNSVTQNIPVGFTLQSYILLIVQSPTVSQSNNTIVISGSLLNEGFSSAYYASVSASVGNRSNGASYYAGEVDPNTPVPFSVTIPYTPGSRANQQSSVTVRISYKDLLGSSQQSSISVPATLSSASQLLGTQATQTSSGPDIFLYIEYAIIVVVVAVAIGGVFVVRRTRKRSVATKPEEQEDKAVI